MSECVKLSKTIGKYSYRNSPPFPANKCKTMKKKGNDGKFYKSHRDKNGVYKWVAINGKNKTVKNTATVKELQHIAEKYKVTKSGTKQELARRIVKLKGRSMNQTDKKWSKLIYNNRL